MASRYVVEATEAHTQRVAELMRKADRDEAQAFSGMSPEEAMAETLHLSTRVWAAVIPGTDDAYSVFGVGSLSLLSETGIPWLLSTDEILDHAVMFARHSRSYIEHMHSVYPLLENYACKKNRISWRWLQWCGFKFDSEPTVVRGHDFYRFELGESECV